MHPLRLAIVPPRVHVPQVGNPCCRRISAKDWSECWWALSFYGVENWLFLRKMCGTKRLGSIFQITRGQWGIFVQPRFLSCCFLLVRYGIKARLARTVAKAAKIPWSKILTVCNIARVKLGCSLFSIVCSNLRPFVSTGLRIEKNFNYRWTRHIYWCRVATNWYFRWGTK